ncbi:F-box/kelch-repeat protein [Cardamine amara subsp. amara]|uniref:F-box/kelch-repeat protein n=1 Tax=Cardamine amara subsp. amara TaxID=228776 RepID=A0ABD1A7X3_CARAN
MTIQQFLPNDLVEEILCRVPATSLKRLRYTCKRWNRLLNNTRFISKHSDKAAKQFLVLMLTDNYVICPMSINLHGVVPSVELKNMLRLLDPYYNNLYQFEIAEVFHCDGLLLGTGRYGSTIVDWNPCTGQTRWIELRNVCKKKSRRFVLGYSQDNKSYSKSYKILTFKDDGEDSEIYEFNSDSWRSILDDGTSIIPGWSIFECSDHNVSLKGNTYWVAYEK